MINQDGYIAITSILLLSLLVFVIGSSLSLLSVSHTQMSLQNAQTTASLNLLEGCIEEALLHLSTTNSIPATVSLPEASCSVTINSQLDSSWDFTTSLIEDNRTLQINVVANRGSTVEVTSWRQL